MDAIHVTTSGHLSVDHHYRVISVHGAWAQRALHVNTGPASVKRALNGML